MKPCPYCNKRHVNSIEQELCPLRPEQVPLMIEQFGPLGKGAYGVTDCIRYIANGQEHTAVILWIIAPGNAGTNVQPSEKVRYIVEREIPVPMPQEKIQLMKAIQGRESPLTIHAAQALFGNPFGFADEYEEVYEGAVIGRK